MLPGISDLQPRRVSWSANVIGAVARELETEAQLPWETTQTQL